jgi:uncharacterized RDD family membrane protein YckC
MKRTQLTWLLTLTTAFGLCLGAAAIDTPNASSKTGYKRAPIILAAVSDQPAENEESTNTAVAEDQSSTNNSSGSEPAEPSRPRRHHGVNKDAVVVVGRDVELKAGDSAEAVVVIGGSAKILGKVNEAAVAIGGDVDIVGGDVGQAAVAVLGNVKAGQGAKIHEDAVAVGGTVDVSPDSTVNGRIQSIDLGGLGLPHMDWVRQWLRHCVLKLRPLAPQVGFVWVITGIFVLLYVLVGSLFPHPVAACVGELSRRPATTFLMGLLTKLLVPVIMLILAITGIGLFVVPFVIAALFLGAVVGKTALLEWLGFRIGSQFGGSQVLRPVGALLIGAALIILLYLVPVLGLLTFGIVSLWGLGGAVMAAFGGFRREQPEKASTPPPGPAPMTFTPPPPPGPTSPGFAMTMPVAPTSPEAQIAGNPGSAPETLQSNPSTEAGAPPLNPNPPPLTPNAPSTAVTLPEALAYPKAGFWERMGAAFLDCVLVGIVGAVTGPFVLVVALAYFAGMWAWKGTTIGGIVLGLKVVRVDGKPVTFAVSLVRALAAAFSVVVLFLGFLWIAWDQEKQGWHDRIAGTIVLRLPRGTPLI